MLWTTIGLDIAKSVKRTSNYFREYALSDVSRYASYGVRRILDVGLGGYSSPRETAQLALY
jgi:hypothetical protein